jgi:Zn finger protein HypA/HybF involved in hydrogenase expression
MNAVMKKKNILKNKISVMIKSLKVKCNICNENYSPKSRFERFCPQCREHSELYRYREWPNCS